MDKEKKVVIEMLKNKAEVFLENNIKAFIKDFHDSYYFCDIIFIGDIYLMIHDFEKNQKFKKYWTDIVIFEEYQTKEERDKIKEVGE